MNQATRQDAVELAFAELRKRVEAAGWASSTVQEARVVLTCLLDPAQLAAAPPSIRSKAAIVTGWNYLEYWYFEGAPLSVQMALWVGLECGLLHLPAAGGEWGCRFKAFFHRQLAFEAAKRKSEVTGGWLFPLEAELFWDRIDSVRTVHGDVLEIGSWAGRSTILLAAGLEALSPSKRLHVVDDWRFGGQPDLYPYLTEDRNLRAEFEENVRPWRERIVIHGGLFQELARSLRFGGEGFSLLFHDAGHTPSDFARDLPLIEPLMNPGAVLLIHDYESKHFTESQATIKEWVSENPALLFETVVGTTAVVRKQR